MDEFSPPSVEEIHAAIPATCELWEMGFRSLDEAGKVQASETVAHVDLAVWYALKLLTEAKMPPMPLRPRLLQIMESLSDRGPDEAGRAVHHDVAGDTWP